MNIWDINFGDGYQWGDIFKSLLGIDAHTNSAIQGQGLFGGLQNMWKGFTGERNTELANSATAALQEDAQGFNAAEAEKQREFEHNEAEIARQWQEQMSNTAVQRQAADYQAAGFNPWLAAGASGASTGSVGIASGNSASSAMGQGINATKSGAEMLAMAGLTAASIVKVIKLLAK